MSWTLFKANIIRKTNPKTTNNNIETVAKIWANEYDACVKRGRDFINLESIQTGNLQLMETLFKVALLKGLSTPPGVDFSLPNEFGNGVKAYWAGAQMRPFPTPLIPAPGSIQNISVNSNVCIKTGTWPIYPPLKPAKKQEVIVDMFILAATIHLFTIGGFIQTTSLYPSTPTPIPGPGIINWTGYLIPPPIPTLNFGDDDSGDINTSGQTDLSDSGDTNTSGQTDLSDNDDTSDQLGDESLNQLGEFDVNTNLETIINISLPSDVNKAIDIEKYIESFKEQIRIGGTKCD